MNSTPDQGYERLQKKLHEVFAIEPTDLSIRPLTRIYKRSTRHLKTMPFIYIIPMAFLVTILLYVVFGHLVVKLASLLQYGF
jgi:hypothetical protein